MGRAAVLLAVCLSAFTTDRYLISGVVQSKKLLVLRSSLCPKSPVSTLAFALISLEEEQLISDFFFFLHFVIIHCLLCFQTKLNHE